MCKKKKKNPFWVREFTAIGPNPLFVSERIDSTFVRLSAAIHHFSHYYIYYLKCLLFFFYCSSCDPSHLPHLGESSPGLSLRARFIFIYVFSLRFSRSSGANLLLNLQTRRPSIISLLPPPLFRFMHSFSRTPSQSAGLFFFK